MRCCSKSLWHGEFSNSSRAPLHPASSKLQSMLSKLKREMIDASGLGSHEHQKRPTVRRYASNAECGLTTTDHGPLTTDHPPGRSPLWGGA